jgi:hypothetical protein
MTRYLTAALAVVMLTGAAYAQSAAPAAPLTAAPPAAGATTTITLAATDAAKLKTWIATQKTASVPAPAGATLSVGATLPLSVMLYPIAASAGVSSASTLQYAVVDNMMILVSPSDHKIVYVFS